MDKEFRKTVVIAAIPLILGPIMVYGAHIMSGSAIDRQIIMFSMVPGCTMWIMRHAYIELMRQPA